MLLISELLYPFGYIHLPMQDSVSLGFIFGNQSQGSRSQYLKQGHPAVRKRNKNKERNWFSLFIKLKQKQK